MRSATSVRTSLLSAAALVAAAGMTVAHLATARSATCPDAFVDCFVEPAGTVQERGERPVLSLASLAEPSEISTADTRVQEERLQSSRPPRKLRAHAARISGKVVDLDGDAVIGVEVSLESDAQRTDSTGSTGRTDAAGHFELMFSAGGGLFQVAPHSGYVGLASTRAGSSGEALLVATRRGGSLAMEVIDGATGLALQHATATLEVRAELPHPGLHRIPFEAVSDANGTAYFGAVPDLPGISCRVERVGYVAESILLDELGANAPQITLDPVPTAASIKGRVVNASGLAVAGAEVNARGRTTRSRGDGAFTLSCAPGAPGDWLLSARHPSHGTADRRCTSRTNADEARTEFELVLEPSAPPRPLPIRTESGESLSSVRVVPVDSLGNPNPFAAHWHCAQADAEAQIGLSTESPGHTAPVRMALAKDGTLLGRVELGPTGEDWVVVPVDVDR